MPRCHVKHPPASKLAAHSHAPQYGSGIWFWIFGFLSAGGYNLDICLIHTFWHLCIHNSTVNEGHNLKFVAYVLPSSYATDLYDFSEVLMKLIWQTKLNPSWLVMHSVFLKAWLWGSGGRLPNAFSPVSEYSIANSPSMRLGEPVHKSDFFSDAA